MNHWILTAAALSAATVLIHLFGGGPEVHDPLLASGLSVPLKAYASILWHAVTVVLIANSTALLVAARHPTAQPYLVLMAVAQYLGFALLFGVYGMTRLGSLMPMPQWIIFVAISALALTGLWRSASVGNLRVQQ